MSNNLTVDDWISLINEEYFFLIEGGHSIVKECYIEELNSHELEYISQDRFKLRWNTHTVAVKSGEDDEASYKPVGNVWLKSRGRREYDKIVFDPSGQCSKRHYNSWKGFAYAPDATKNCDIYLDHIWRNACDQKQERYDYLLNWMALAVQKPHIQGQVAVVLGGKKGTGKNSITDYFGELFGTTHFKIASNRKHVTGDFTKHLRGCVVLFANEAIWAGSHQDEGILKSLITDNVRMDEAKGVDAHNTKNYIHLMMATNEEWVVPATLDERRFFVIEMGTENLQDKEFFERMKNVMRNEGGMNKLLHFLQTRDISKFNVFDVPDTEALWKQKRISMDPHHAWLFSCLDRGYVVDGIDWEDFIPISAVYEEYHRYCDRLGKHYGKKDEQRFGEFIHDVFVGLPLKVSKRNVDSFFRELGLVKAQSKQTRHYSLPPLEDCRAAFDKLSKQHIKWKPVLRLVRTLDKHEEEAI